MSGCLAAELVTGILLQPLPTANACKNSSIFSPDACSNFPVSSHWPKNGPYPVALIMYSPSSRRSSLLLNSWLCTVAYVPQNTQTRLWQLASCYGSRQQATLRMHLVLAILLSVGTNWLPTHKNLARLMSFHNCGASKGSLKLLISDHRQGLQHQRTLSGRKCPPTSSNAASCIHVKCCSPAWLCMQYLGLTSTRRLGY